MTKKVSLPFFEEHFRDKDMELVERILILEDDDDLRTLVRELLGRNGYSVTESRTIQSAMSLLSTGQFDLLLLDINLPDGNGFRVAEYVREKDLPTKVIVMTGESGLDNAIRGATVGAQDFIAKPFTPQYLLKAIKNVLSIEVPN
jgi:DNA-binding response OmpR family regulator